MPAYSSLFKPIQVYSSLFKTNPAYSSHSQPLQSSIHYSQQLRTKSNGVSKGKSGPNCKVSLGEVNRPLHGWPLLGPRKKLFKRNDYMSLRYNIALCGTRCLYFVTGKASLWLENLISSTGVKICLHMVPQNGHAFGSRVKTKLWPKHLNN